MGGMKSRATKALVARTSTAIRASTRPQGIDYGVNQSGNFGFNQGASQNTGGSQSSGALQLSTRAVRTSGASKPVP